mgnify:CR=1 FL=1
MRIACDTGGTFTDLVVETTAGLRIFKASTTPDDPVRGVLDALTLAAVDAGVDRATFLGRADTFVHGTTRAINAILTGGTARTAFLTTSGHPDILVIREGLGMRLPNQGHYFNGEALYKRFTPAGPDHAQIAASAGMAAWPRSRCLASRITSAKVMM